MMARQDDHIRHTIRIPRDVYERICALPGEGSINAKIVNTLAAGTGPAPLTAAHMADALSCFWNAAIGNAHNRQSEAAMDAASVMAEGFAAVSERLLQYSDPLPMQPMVSALQQAERFVSGFEGDELQTGVEELLASIRAAMGYAV